MATLGGNLCLDTRCTYYNQTYFWREALGFCLKKDGTLCHVVEGGSKCVLFERVRGSDYPVLVGLLWNRATAASLFGLPKEEVPFRIAAAIGP